MVVHCGQVVFRLEVKQIEIESGYCLTLVCVQVELVLQRVQIPLKLLHLCRCLQAQDLASKKLLIWLQKGLVSIAKQAVLEFLHGVYSHFVSKF